MQKKSASTTPRDPSSDDAEAQNASTTAEDSSLAAVQGQIAPTSGRESSSDAAEAQNASTAAEDFSLAAVQGQIAPTADREPSSNAAEAQMTPEAAQRIVDAYSCGGPVAPTYLIEIVNSLNKIPPKNLDTDLNKLLQHIFCHNTTIPLYDVNQSHMPFDVNTVDPSDWFEFFWPDSLLEYIVKESNKYIQNKNKNKN